MVNRDWSPAFVSVTCKCGRALRAKVEQVGTEVRCWDCHQMVPVPIPRQGQEVARELSEGALVMIKGPGTNSLVAAAALVTAVLSIPVIGVWCSVLVLTLGASAYGEIVRRVGRGHRDGPEAGWSNSLVPNSIPKALLCSSMAAGTVAPLWILNAGLHQSPHWDAIGLTIATLAWTIVPLLMVIHYVQTGEGSPLGARRCLKFLNRHRFATILALAVVPLTLAATEAVIAFILYISGNLPFYALDYMPIPSSPVKPIVAAGVVFYQHMDYRDFPDSKYIAGYFDGLRNGYWFVGSIPASLSLSSRAGLDAVAIGMYEIVYTLARVFITLCVVTGLITAFAIQARWLGAILGLEDRRPA